QTIYTLSGLKGFNRWYNYAYKHTHMITKEANQRLKILLFWRNYGLKAVADAFGAKRSTLYGWRKIYKDKKIYHHRQKVYHNVRVKPVKKEKKERKPDTFKTNEPGDLIEIDTVVKFAWNIKRYIITAVDVHSRYSFAFCYERPLSINARDFIQKLRTVFPYRIKAIQTDNGSEFHRYFRDYLKEQKIIQYWNYPGRPYRQGHIEKFNRTIQEEFIDWNEILLENTDTFNRKLTDWLIWYNTQRFHWSLNLLSPVDYLIKNSFVSNMTWTDTPNTN
ncbi:MAG: DDE-type integrase/transposase/recombinase, partial [Candidatus Falkowbacteria bacterium]